MNKRTFLFLATVALFSIAANLAHPVTPAFIVERQLDSSMFGVALAAMSIMRFLFSPFWGRLCNYMSTRRIHLITCAGYALGQLFFMRATTEAGVIAGRMFAGIFIGGCFTSFANYIINVAPDSAARNRNLALLVTIQNVAAACGYFVGGMLGLISTTVPFAVQAATLALAGVICLLVCEDDTPYKEKPDAPLSVRDADPFRSFVTAREYLTPMLGLIFAVVAISAIGQNSYEQCFHYYIKDQFGMSSAYNGTFKAAIALLTLALNATVCVWLQRRTDINRSFLWVLAACTGIIGSILIFRGRVLFVAAYILYSSVNIIQLPLTQSIVASRCSAASRNSLMGVSQAMVALGGVFGALFAGLIYKQGPMLPFVLAFCAYALSVAIGAVYVRRYSRGE